MIFLKRLKVSVFYRLKLIWGALFYKGSKLTDIFPKNEIVEIYGNANLFGYFPLARTWNGGPPKYSHALCRGENTNYSTELDVIHLMYDLTRMLKAKCAIEVGIYKGACTLALAQALHDNGGGDVHCVDIFDTNFADIKSAINDLQGSSKAFFYHGDSASVADLGVLPKADLIFIDADHTYEPVKKDVSKYWPLVNSGGVLAMHDTVMWEGTRLVANELFKEGNKMITIATSGGSGISLIFKA